MVGTVAPLVLLDLGRGFPYRIAHARAKAGHGAAVGEGDGLVGINLDELVDDSLVSLDARVAVFGSEIALAVCFQQRVGEHRRARGLKIVALARGTVHHLIPHSRLLVLPLYHGIEVFLEQLYHLASP